MSNDKRIDYIEVNVSDVPRAKAFFNAVFGWEFTDYGPDYAAFNDGRMSGGFTSDGPVNATGGALVIIYADDLPATHARIVAAGGSIVKVPFAFPGGWRLHFTDPDGYEWGVWSEVEKP